MTGWMAHHFFWMAMKVGAGSARRGRVIRASRKRDIVARGVWKCFHIGLGVVKSWGGAAEL